jgi:hypothetical protein
LFERLKVKYRLAKRGCFDLIEVFGEWYSTVKGIPIAQAESLIKRRAGLCEKDFDDSEL